MANDTPAASTGARDAAERAGRVLGEALAAAFTEAELALQAEREARSPYGQLVETIERFSDVLGKLVEFTERLGERVSELSEAVVALAEAQSQSQAAAPGARPQAAEVEPAFAPGGEGVDVTIAAVPGFQGLMELQRSLVRMPQVQSAAVRKYQEDEAAIQLVLSQPTTASQIVENVAAGTNRQIVVDESRPEALRLRLRFLDGEGA
jgi:hypothetical protein